MLPTPSATLTPSFPITTHRPRFRKKQDPLSDGHAHQLSRPERRAIKAKRATAFDVHGPLSTALFLSAEKSSNGKFMLLACPGWLILELS